MQTAGREDLAGRSDQIIFEVACSEGRAGDHEQHQGLPLAAEWLAQGRVHPGLILLPSARTRTRSATAAVAAAIENALRDHPDGLSVSERWIGPRRTYKGPGRPACIAPHMVRPASNGAGGLSQFLSDSPPSRTVHRRPSPGMFGQVADGRGR